MAKNLRELLDGSFAQYGDRAAIRVLRPEPSSGELQYQPVTYAELRTRRDCLAAGLHQLGLRRGRRVGVLAEGSEEALVLFLAADLLGVSVVPLCTKTAAEVLAHSIRHSGLEVLFVDRRGADQYQRIASLLEQPPRLVNVQGPGGGQLGWSELLAMGQGQTPPDVDVEPDDESKVLYTSGSSGLPKGVVQTHRNIVANVEEAWDVIAEREPVRMFKSAPDYHSLGILNIYYPLAKGWTLDLARSPERVLADVRLSAPEAMLTVPLILDKVYAGVRREIEAGGLKGKLVMASVQARQRLSRGQATLTDRLFDRALGGKVVAKIRAQLATRVGPNLGILIVGSAKADPEALDFFDDVLDIRTYEGYGTTECAPLISANHRFGRRVGSAGRPFIESRLVTPAGKEIGYFDPASGVCRSSDGKAAELWVAGPNVMRGYLGDPDETAKVLIEDETGKIWYRTGDLFSLDEEGFLTFRGRVGRQFKLSNGEFVNPELLERLYSRVSLIEHVLVYGDPSRGYPLPLITVNLEEARKLTNPPGLPVGDDAALRVHPLLAEHLRELLLAEASAVEVASHARPQRVLLLPEPLSEDAGTLTKGLKKVVPGAVVERYREMIDQAYAG
jgi:long-chain acyl-CoA synthetase